MAKLIAILLSVQLAAGLARASDSLVIHSLSEIDSIPILDQASFLLDPTNELQWQDVRQRPFALHPNLSSYIDSVCGHKRLTLWLKLHITNAMDDSLKLVMLFHRYAFYKEVVVLNGTNSTVYNPNYFFTRTPKQNRKIINVLLLPGQSALLFLRIYNPYANLYPQEFLITNRKAYLSARGSSYHKAYSDYIFKIMYLAVVAFITMHTLVQFFIRKRKEFIIYAFYSTSVFLFFLYRLEHSIYYDVLFSYFPYIYKYCNNPLSLLVYYTYFRFARQFVDFKSLAPRFHRTIIWTERLLLAAFFVDLFCNIVLNNFWIREVIFTALRIVLLLISFIGIYLLLSSGKRVFYFFGIGSLALIIGSLLAMIFTFYPDANPLAFDSIRYMQYGIVVELLCFTSGLSYKSHLIEVEKQNTQKQLINQLEENHRLQEELNTRLEARVKEQTEKLVSQQQQLEKEREQQLTLEFKRKLTEMELQVLKSQLNPHFYFNTLNNLYGLTIIDSKKAPDAILKLSDIMEYVIYDCRSEKVPLSKELKFISSYVDLEKLRYEDNVPILLDIKGESEGKFISPLLLIQFIENAFKHGMEQNKNENHLQITISVANNHLLYRSVNSIRAKDYNSNGVGLANVQKRLAMLYPNQHQLTIKSEDGEFMVELHLELS